MINYNTRNWVEPIFKFHKSDTFRLLLFSLFLLAVYTTAVVLLEVKYFDYKHQLTPAFHSVMGFMLSILLVFRTNTAYERWWEGRKLWGSLVNNSRNLALKLNAMLDESHKSKQKFAELMGNYADTLKTHLRGKKSEYAPKNVHQPNHIAGLLINELNILYKQNAIDGNQLIVLNAEISSFAEICGACERIRKTPIPFSYSQFLKKFIFVYIITLPFGFVADFGYAIIPAVMFTFYVLASLELLAEMMEDPFGTDTNDLPTEEIARTIQNNVNEILL